MNVSKYTDDNDSTSIEEELTTDSITTAGDDAERELRSLPKDLSSICSTVAGDEGERSFRSLPRDIQKMLTVGTSRPSSCGSCSLPRSSRRTPDIVYTKVKSDRGTPESLCVKVSMVKRVTNNVNPKYLMVRPSSVPRKKSQKPFEKQMGLYPQSLKILGIKVPTPANQQVRPSRCTSSLSWVGTPAKLKTRVTRRSTSLDDVKRVIPQFKNPELINNLSIDPHQRSVLSQAIYEEWYMTKKKKMNENINRQKITEEQQEQVKLDQKSNHAELSKEKVDLWWKEKRKQQREKNKIEQQKLEERLRILEDKVKEKALCNGYHEIWKERKETFFLADRGEKLEHQRKIQQMKQEQQVQEKQQRIDAEEGFQLWLDDKREKQRQQRAKRQEERKVKDKERRERQELAKSGYEYWKKEKETSGRKTPVDMILDDALRIDDPARSAEALEAYEKWLDEADKRQIVDNINLQKMTLLSTLKPNWNPGGGTGLSEVEDQN